MNKAKSLLPLHQSAVQALVLGLGLCWCGSVSAQNLVKNPGFESPIGTNAYGNFQGGANFPLGTTTGGEVYDPSWKATWNWMVAYSWGGPADFELKERCSTAHSGDWSARFRPAHDKLAHAYYTQTITNLQVGHSYAVSGWMMEDRWKGVTDPLRDEMLVYLEAVGGQGTPTADGRFAVLAVATVQSNLDAPYTYPSTTWLQFTNRQIPAADGTIEIRLHHNKRGWVLADKLERMGAYFDDISLTP
jgi:hypothetical protein